MARPSRIYTATASNGYKYLGQLMTCFKFSVQLSIAMVLVEAAPVVTS